MSRPEIGDRLEAFLRESADGRLLNASFTTSSLDQLISVFPDIASLKQLRGERAALFDYYKANGIDTDISLDKPL